MKIRIAPGRTLTALLAALFSQAALATPPAAPVVTVGAGLKQLQFDWNYVPRAGTLRGLVQVKSGAAWARFADTPGWRPRANVNISGHLLHWIEARYVIKACNPSGCTSSPEISVSQLMRDSVGYFKASTPLSAGPVGLGGEIAMSEDGSTIAAGSSRSIDGNVVVFRKGSAGWAEEAQLSPSLANQERGGSVEYDVAINGNGTVIALGAPAEVRPGTDAGESPSIGAVYCFAARPADGPRNSGSSPILRPMTLSARMWISTSRAICSPCGDDGERGKARARRVNPWGRSSYTATRAADGCHSPPFLSPTIVASSWT